MNGNLHPKTGPEFFWDNYSLELKKKKPKNNKPAKNPNPTETGVIQFSMTQ